MRGVYWVVIVGIVASFRVYYGERGSSSVVMMYHVCHSANCLDSKAVVAAAAEEEEVVESHKVEEEKMIASSSSSVSSSGRILAKRNKSVTTSTFVSESSSYVVLQPTSNKENKNGKNAGEPATPKVCFAVQTQGIFLMDGSPKESLKLRADILKHITLHSLNLASPSGAVVPPYVPIKIKGWNANISSMFPRFSSIGKYVGSFPNLALNYTTSDSKATASIIDWFKANQERCEWIVVTRIDSDDPLTPGFWQYITDLIHQGRFNASGAGLVGTKSIPVVELTDSKCRVKVDTVDHIKSQGISVVYQRDNFIKMGYPAKMGNHAQVLGELRVKYQTIIRGKEVRNFEPKLAQIDHYLLNETGVVFVDTMSEKWGPPGLWWRTSLSAHFPWMDLINIKEGCKKEHFKSNVQNVGMNRFSDDFLTHLYDYRKLGSLSLMEACAGNKHFIDYQRIPNEAKVSSCKEFVKRYAKLTTNK